MATELQSTSRVVLHGQTFSNEHGNLLFATIDALALSEAVETLQICQREARALAGSIKSEQSTVSTTKVKRLATRFRWVFQKASLERLCLDLNSQKLSLLGAISTSGRRNEIQIRKVYQSSEPLSLALGSMHFIMFWCQPCVPRMLNYGITPRASSQCRENQNMLWSIGLHISRTRTLDLFTCQTWSYHTAIEWKTVAPFTFPLGGNAESFPKR